MMCQMYIFDTERVTFVVTSHGFTVNSLWFAGALWGRCRLNRVSGRRWGATRAHIWRSWDSLEPTTMGSPETAGWVLPCRLAKTVPTVVALRRHSVCQKLCP